MAKETIDPLEVVISGDDSEYEKMTKKVIKETEEMARKVEERATQMVSNVSAKVTAAGGRAGHSVPPMLPKALGAPGGGTGAGGMPTSLRDLFPEQFDEVMRPAPGGVGAGGAAAAARGAGGLSGGAVTAVGGGLEAFGIPAALAPAAIVAAEALGVFALSVTATTYAISGTEGVANMLPNMLEGLKIALYGVTAGYVDLTLASKNAAQDEQETANILSGGQARAMELITEREARIKNLSGEIKRLRDHSIEAEAAFKEMLAGQLGQQGVQQPRMFGISSNVEIAFNRERIDDITQAHQKLADTYGMSRKEILEYKLTLNAATDEERRHALAIEDKMAAVDEAKRIQRDAIAEITRAEKEVYAEMERKEEKDQHDAESIAKKNMTPAEKQQEEMLKAQDLFRKDLLTPEEFERELTRINKDPKKLSVEGGISGIRAGSGESADLAHKQRIDELQLQSQPNAAEQKKADQENKILYAQMIIELKAQTAALAGAAVVKAANVGRR